MNKPTFDQYLALLFNPGEEVCLAKNLGDNKPMALSTCKSHVLNQWVTLNPIHTHRKKANVTAYRNFLVEFDKYPDETPIPLTVQLQYVMEKGMPYTTCTFSGSKSFHFVISLEKPLSDAATYEYYVSWIYNIMHLADQKTKDGARFTRVPEGTNEKTGNAQVFVKARHRVSNDELLEWLSRFPACRPAAVAFRASGEELTLDPHPWAREEVVEYLKRKFPLEAGMKQGHLMCWARMLIAKAHVTDSLELEDILASNDLGRNRLSSEYRRAAQRCLSSLLGSQNSTQIHPNTKGVLAHGPESNQTQEEVQHA